MNNNGLKTLTVLNKLYEQEKQLKKELSETFLTYFDSLTPSKRLRQMESLLYDTHLRHLPTLDRRLTSQENKCLYLASKGKEIKEMARIMGLSQRTIKFHRANIVKKLEVPNLMAAVGLGAQVKYAQSESSTSPQLMTTDEISRLKNSIDLIAGIHWWKDINGVYQGCNLAMLEMVGFSSIQEIIGKTDYDLPWKESARLLQKHDQQVIKSGKLQSFEETGKLINDNIVTVICNKMPLVNKSNEIIGSIGSYVDIIKLKKELNFESIKAIVA